MIKKTCGNCALQAEMGSCPIFNREMPEDECCPMHAFEFIECDLCGKHIIKDAVIEQEDGKTHLICHHCAQLSMCATCIGKMNCYFEQDTNCKEPPFIVVQEHLRPNMTVQKKILNPKRIEETCAKGCHCYYEAGLADGIHCIKQLPNSGCENYKTAWRK